MNPKTEKQVLQIYVNLIEKADSKISTYRWLSRILYGVGFLGAFAIYQGYNGSLCSAKQLVSIAAVTGAAFPVGFYFSQLAMQIPIFVRYLSKSEMCERINEINT